MKIKRKDLNRLVERFLLEAEKTDPKGGINLEKISDDYDEITDMGSGFADAQIFRATGERPRHPDADAHAVTDARKGSNRGRFPDIAFGDTQGVNTVVKDYHDPNDKDIRANQDYMQSPYNLGPREKSVHDLEHTIHSPDLDDEDTDEDTEESPFGTQYSLEDTLEVPDYSDKQFDEYDEIDRDDSQDVITYEDEDGNERTFMGGKEVTPGISSKGSGMIEKIRKFLNI